MKKLHVVTTDIAIGEDKKKLTTVDLVKTVASALRKNSNGVNVEEMKKRLRIFDAVETKLDILYFEDADADLLKDLTRTMEWAIVHKDIAAFCDAIENMEVAEVSKS